MKSWRTTISGFGLIFGGAAALVSMLLGGAMPTPEQWTMFGGAIVTGVGLINAADAKKLPAATQAETPPQGPPSV